MTKKKSKNACSKCHSPPMGKKCSGLKGAADEVAMDLAGKNDSAGLLKNCKSTSKQIQKQCKQSSQAPPPARNLTNLLKTVTRHLPRRSRFLSGNRHQYKTCFPLLGRHL